MVTPHIEIWAKHSNLGLCSITRECIALQAINPDPTSTYILHDDEVKEVTKSMVTLLEQ